MTFIEWEIIACSNVSNIFLITSQGGIFTCSTYRTRYPIWYTNYVIEHLYFVSVRPGRTPSDCGGKLWSNENVIFGRLSRIWSCRDTWRVGRVEDEIIIWKIIDKPILTTHRLCRVRALTKEPDRQLYTYIAVFIRESSVRLSLCRFIIKLIVH